MAFEKYILPEAGEKSIAVHLMRALLEQFLLGVKTALHTKNEIEAVMSTSLTPNEGDDLLSITTYIDNGADLFDKKNRMDEFYRVLICAQESKNFWTTRESLRAKLNWSEPD